MKRTLFILAALMLVFSASSAQEVKRGEITKKDDKNRTISVNLGIKDGIKVGSAFVLHDENDRELGCILAASVEEETFWSDLIPMGDFSEIEVGYYVEELGAGCRIEGAVVTYIPKGFFGMGDNKKDNEMPMHSKHLNAYYIDKYEVTNGEYKRFIDDKKRAAPFADSKEAEPYNWKDNNYPAGKENHPVVLVTEDDAKGYCEYIGKRLPTEAEWEKAARGTGARIWPWGNVWDGKKLNCKDSGLNGTAIIGSFPDDLSPYDVVDMGGNVSEWTSSEYTQYENNHLRDEDYSKGLLVIKGGSFKSERNDTRTPTRKFTSSDTKSIDIGFRCVKDIY